MKNDKSPTVGLDDVVLLGEKLISSGHKTKKPVRHETPEMDSIVKEFNELSLEKQRLEVELQVARKKREIEQLKSRLKQEAEVMSGEFASQNKSPQVASHLLEELNAISDMNSKPEGGTSQLGKDLLDHMPTKTMKSGYDAVDQAPLLRVEKWPHAFCKSIRNFVSTKADDIQFIAFFYG